MIDEIPEDIKGESATPATHHIFILRKMQPKYPEPAQTFFLYFAKRLLYLSKRAHLDIHMKVSILCTRVRDPDTDDYNNLAR